MKRDINWKHPRDIQIVEAALAGDHYKVYPDNIRILTDFSMDTLLKKYFNGYSPMLEKEKIQLEDGVVYQNLGMDAQAEDLKIQPFLALDYLQQVGL